MKGTLFAAAAIVALGSTLPASADPKTAEPAPTAEAAARSADAQPKPTKYCFDTELTGSRISKRVCQTREQWAVEGVTVPGRR